MHISHHCIAFVSHNKNRTSNNGNHSKMKIRRCQLNKISNIWFICLPVSMWRKYQSSDRLVKLIHFFCVCVCDHFVWECSVYVSVIKLNRCVVIDKSCMTQTQNVANRNNNSFIDIGRWYMASLEVRVYGREYPNFVGICALFYPFPSSSSFFCSFFAFSWTKNLRSVTCVQIF